MEDGFDAQAAAGQVIAKLIMVPWWVAERQSKMVDEIDKRVTDFAYSIGCAHDIHGNLVPQNDHVREQMETFVRRIKREICDA